MTTNTSYGRCKLLQLRSEFVSGQNTAKHVVKIYKN